MRDHNDKRNSGIDADGVESQSSWLEASEESKSKKQSDLPPEHIIPQQQTNTTSQLHSGEVKDGQSDVEETAEEAAFGSYARYGESDLNDAASGVNGAAAEAQSASDIGAKDEGSSFVASGLSRDLETDVPFQSAAQPTQTVSSTGAFVESASLNATIDSSETAARTEMDGAASRSRPGASEFDSSTTRSPRPDQNESSNDESNPPRATTPPEQASSPTPQPPQGYATPENEDRLTDAPLETGDVADENPSEDASEAQRNPGVQPQIDDPLDEVASAVDAVDDALAGATPNVTGLNLDDQLDDLADPVSDIEDTVAEIIEDVDAADALDAVGDLASPVDGLGSELPDVDLASEIDASGAVDPILNSITDTVEDLKETIDAVSDAVDAPEIDSLLGTAPDVDSGSILDTVTDAADDAIETVDAVLDSVETPNTDPVADTLNTDPITDPTSDIDPDSVLETLTDIVDEVIETVDPVLETVDVDPAVNVSPVADLEGVADSVDAPQPVLETVEADPAVNVPPVADLDEVSQVTDSVMDPVSETFETPDLEPVIEVVDVDPAVNFDPEDIVESIVNEVDDNSAVLDAIHGTGDMTDVDAATNDPILGEASNDGLGGILDPVLELVDDVVETVETTLDDTRVDDAVPTPGMDTSPESVGDGNPDPASIAPSDVTQDVPADSENLAIGPDEPTVSDFGSVLDEPAGLEGDSSEPSVAPEIDPIATVTPETIDLEGVPEGSEDASSDTVAGEPIAPAASVDFPSNLELTALRPEIPQSVTEVGDPVTLNVRLGGEAYRGDPKYEIIVDGEKVASGKVDWSRETTTDGKYTSFDDVEWRDVAIDLEMPEGGFQSIEVRFPNDAWKRDVGDRNLLVDNITIDGATFEAEALETNYKGGRFADGGSQERMPWKGSLEFDVTNMAEVAAEQATPDGAYVLGHVEGAVVGQLNLNEEQLAAGFDIEVSDPRFEVVGNDLKLKEGVSLDHEEVAGLSLEVTISDGNAVLTQSFDVAVADTPEPTVTEDMASDMSMTAMDQSSEVANDLNGETTIAPQEAVTDGLSDTDDLDADDADAQVGLDLGSDAPTDPAIDQPTLPLETEDVVAESESDNSGPSGLSLETSTDNLVVNGSFEEFDVAEGRWKSFDEDASGGWDVSGTAEVWDGLFAMDSSEGQQHVELDSGRGEDGLSQTLTTEPGHVYDLSMDLRERVTDGTDTVEVYWNGELVSEINPGSSQWETFDMKVVGTGQDVLEIREAIGENDTYGALLDNVSVTEVPNTIAEGVEGAVVGTIAVADADDSAHEFTVSDARFEVADGQLKLRDGETLDAEDASQLSIEVTATDSNGGQASAVFDITVADSSTLQGLPVSETAMDAVTQSQESVKSEDFVEGEASAVFVAKFFDMDSSISKLSDVDWDSTPTHQSGVKTIEFANSADSFWEGGSKDTFGAQIEGQIEAPESGTYTFTLGADDGAMLFIDGQPIIDNDGLHAYKSETVEVELAEGPHAIEVIYFENHGHAGLTLEWDGPGIDGPTAVTPMASDALVGIDGVPMPLAVDLGLENAPSEVVLEGVPSGFKVESGENSAQVSEEPASLDGFDLSQLQITPTPGFEGEVKGRVVGLENGIETAEASVCFDVTDSSHCLAPDLVEVGFHVSFFEKQGNLKSLDDVDFDAVPAAEGMYETIEFDRTTDSFWEGGSRNQFAVKVTGEVSVDEGGVYDFRLASDDGSALFINGEEVVDNDHRHGFRNRDGQIELEPGVHQIEIQYFEHGGHAGLTFEYSGPDTGGGYVPVPAHDAPSSDMSAPAQIGLNLDGFTEVSNVALDGLPPGSWVSDGANSQLFMDQSMDVTEWDVGMLEILPPHGVAEGITVELSAVGKRFNGAEMKVTQEVPIEVELPTQSEDVVDMSLWTDVQHGSGADQSSDDATLTLDMCESADTFEEDQSAQLDDQAFAIGG